MSLPPLYTSPGGARSAVPYQVTEGQSGPKADAGEPFGDLLAIMLSQEDPSGPSGGGPPLSLPLPYRQAGAGSGESSLEVIATQNAASAEGDKSLGVHVQPRAELAAASSHSNIGYFATRLETIKSPDDPLSVLNRRQASGVSGSGSTPLSQDEELEAAQSAEVFNEHGLFQSGRYPPPLARRANAGVVHLEGGNGSFSVAPANPTAPAFVDGLSPAASEVMATSRPIGTSLANAAAIARDVPAAGARPALRPSRVPHSLRALLMPGNELRQQIAHEESKLQSSDRGAGLRGRLASLAQDLMRAGSTVNAQVALQATEQGINLLARVDKLSREERARLRLEMVEMLARHGFVASDVRLNGQIEPRHAL